MSAFVTSLVSKGGVMTTLGTKVFSLFYLQMIVECFGKSLFSQMFGDGTVYNCHGYDCIVYCKKEDVFEIGKL